MVLRKKILHFNTVNNVNSKINNPYDQCILNLRTTYKNISKITLKSAEINVKKNYLLNGIDINTNYDWMYRINTESFNVSMGKTIQNYYTVSQVLALMNQKVALTLNLGKSIVFTVNENNFVQVVFEGFESNNCDIVPTKLLGLLGYDLNLPIDRIYNFANDRTIITFNTIPRVGKTSNYVCIYFSNIPSTGNSNADGSPCSFKVPLSTLFVTSDSSNSETDAFFYNEQSNYTQSIEIIDKHFVFSNLNISLFNAYNEIFSSSVLLNWSFSIEIEYITGF